MKKIISLFSLTCVLTACVVVPLTAEQAANKTMKALKHHDIKTLSTLVHPEKGVQFTPYTYIRLDKDMAFPGEELPFLASDENTYIWGEHDGSGEPIELTPSEYFRKFVYDHDYYNAEKIRWNEVMDHGSSIDNAREIYPNGQIVEYYFSGFEEKYDGLDWVSLRLVFEEYERSWYLVGVIHDQWSP